MASLKSSTVKEKNYRVANDIDVDITVKIFCFGKTLYISKLLIKIIKNNFYILSNSLKNSMFNLFLLCLNSIDLLCFNLPRTFKLLELATLLGVHKHEHL